MQAANQKADVVRERYLAVLPSIEEFRFKIEQLLLALLKDSRLKADKVETRCKDPDSFVRKCLNPTKNYSDPLVEITDLVGARVIFYYTADATVFTQLVEREFNIDKLNSINKGAALRANEFGYHSIHYICSIDPVRASLREWRVHAGRKFELQIRTVLQHSWAAISHALQYKSDVEVPHQLQRRLYRLSGLLELADEEFSAIRAEKIELLHRTQKAIQESPRDVGLDIVSVSEFLRISDKPRKLTDIAVKAGFVANEAPIEHYAPRILRAAAEIGFKSVEELDASLGRFIFRAPRVFSAMRKAENASEWGASPSCFVLFALYSLIPGLTKERAASIGWGTSDAMISAMATP